jgi:hypothetical protein
MELITGDVEAFHLSFADLGAGYIRRPQWASTTLFGP